MSAEVEKVVVDAHSFKTKRVLPETDDQFL